MSNKRKMLSVAVVLVGLVVAAITFFPTQKTSSTQTEKSTAPEANVKMDAAINPPKSAPQNPATIAAEWQWQAINEKSQSAIENNVSLPYTPQSVHDALQEVKVDEAGNVILDHGALVSLDEALERIYNKLDGESLQSLQELIQEALPGKTGEQTAQLVGDYSQFLKAKEEFSQMHEGAGAVEQTIESIESDEALYRELQALREVYLGRETAQSLFLESDANAQFMFDTMKLELDNSLSPEERTQRQQEIEAQLKTKIGSTTE